MSSRFYAPIWKFSSGKVMGDELGDLGVKQSESVDSGDGLSGRRGLGWFVDGDGNGEMIIYPDDYVDVRSE